MECWQLVWSDGGRVWNGDWRIIGTLALLDVPRWKLEGYKLKTTVPFDNVQYVYV
jgi:hypothetical protein